MKTALYPGTFDPLTNGHLSLIRRGCDVFDQIIVAVADNTPKFPLFSHEERVEMAREALKNESRVVVEPFSGLTVEYAAQRGVCALLRGLRSAKGKTLTVTLAVRDIKKQAEAGERFTPDTLPANAPHAEFVKATDAMNARLDALDLNTVEIEEIEGPQE